MEVTRVDLGNWALRTSPKFTTGVKYQFHQGFRQIRDPEIPIIIHIQCLRLKRECLMAKIKKRKKVNKEIKDVKINICKINGNRHRQFNDMKSVVWRGGQSYCYTLNKVVILLTRNNGNEVLKFTL